MERKKIFNNLAWKLENFQIFSLIRDINLNNQKIISNPTPD